MKKSARKTNQKQADRKHHDAEQFSPAMMQLLLPMMGMGALSNVRTTLLDFVFQLGLRSVGVLLEQERTMLVGPRNKKNPEGKYERGGTTKSSLTLGGRLIPFMRPRVHTKKKSGMDEPRIEAPLETWEAFAKEDPLTERAVEQMVIGVATRKYKRSLEDLPENIESFGTSKSAVSRRFVDVTSAEFEKLMSQSITSLDIQVLMLDGVAVAGHTIIVALGFDSGGNNHVLGLWKGATENAEVCKSLLANLEEHLPEEEKKSIGAAIQSAYRCANAERAKERLTNCAID